MVLGIDTWVLWLAAAIVLLLVEAATISLIPIWFVCGSSLAVLLDWFGCTAPVQLAAMAASSLVLLAVSRLIIRPRLHQSRETAMSGSAFLGREGKVLDRIDPPAGIGRVVIGGQIWSAASADGQAIEKDTPVCVIAIRGQKTIVRACPGAPAAAYSPAGPEAPAPR